MGTKEKAAKILTKAARVLPGIGSYQDKESLRESDKRLRDHISSRLAQSVATLERSKTELSRTGALSQLKELDDLSRHMDTLSRTIRYAARGYAAVFASNQVDEKVLSDLFEFDLSLKEDINSLETLVSKISVNTKTLDSPLMAELRNLLFGLEKRLGERENLLSLP
jgi:DNA integrity scanning protein DisA with diadenylate cyclase activity